MDDTSHNTIQSWKMICNDIEDLLIFLGHTFWGIYIDNNIIVGHNKVAPESF